MPHRADNSEVCHSRRRPLDTLVWYYHGNTMPTLTLKVSPEFKRRLVRAARRRKISVSELVRTSVEKDVPAEGRGFLFGACAHPGWKPSTYDPGKPAFDEDDWEMLKQ